MPYVHKKHRYYHRDGTWWSMCNMVHLHPEAPWNEDPAEANQAFDEDPDPCHNCIKLLKKGD